MMSEYQFNDYRDDKPPAPGWYVWRLPHKRIEGLAIVFLAEYRWRGAGFEDVLSPSFDYWNGYRVLLPKGSIEWAPHDDGERPKSGREVLSLIGVEKNSPCPFCKAVPTWMYSGRYIGSGPTDTNYWYLECCDWFNGFGTRMNNPIKLSEKRNQILT